MSYVRDNMSYVRNTRSYGRENKSCVQDNSVQLTSTQRKTPGTVFKSSRWAWTFWFIWPIVCCWGLKQGKHARQGATQCNTRYLPVNIWEFKNLTYKKCFFLYLREPKIETEQIYKILRHAILRPMQLLRWISVKMETDYNRRHIAMLNQSLIIFS